MKNRIADCVTHALPLLDQVEEHLLHTLSIAAACAAGRGRPSAGRTWQPEGREEETCEAAGLGWISPWSCLMVELARPAEREWDEAAGMGRRDGEVGGSCVGGRRRIWSHLPPCPPRVGEEDVSLSFPNTERCRGQGLVFREESGEVVIGPAEYSGLMPRPNAKDIQTACILVFGLPMSQYPMSSLNTNIQTLPYEFTMVVVYVMSLSKVVLKP
jgi:hypothetical protein